MAIQILAIRSTLGRVVDRLVTEAGILEFDQFQLLAKGDDPGDPIWCIIFFDDRLQAKLRRLGEKMFAEGLIGRYTERGFNLSRF